MAKKLTSTKARKILHDKEVHGQPLTDKQRRFFGAIAGGAKPYKAEEGGWLDKYDKAQGGKKLPAWATETPRATGDIASYYPAIKRMKEQPKMDETKAEADKRAKEKAAKELSRKAIENQPTIGPARPDYRTDKEKAAQRDEMARREAMRNSALAQTMGSFTPSGSRDIGVIGAETFVNMNPLITGPFLSGTRLYGQASGQNPYGFGESTTGNVLGTVGMLGDVAFLRGAVPSGTASQPITVSEAAPKSSASNLFKTLTSAEDRFTPIERLDTGVKSQLSGVSMGLEEKILSLFSKGKGRSFSEMFPLSKSAKKQAKFESDIANLEGEQFVKDWVYNESGTIQPDVQKKIVDIMFSEGSPYRGGFESNFQTLEASRNPLFSVNTPNKIVSTRFSDVIKNPELNEIEKVRILNNRADALGVNYAGFNTSPASYTFENMGMYNFPYSSKLSTAVHEGAHTMQQLGAFKAGRRGTGFGDLLAKYDPKYKYYTPNLDTEIGKSFAEVMKTPKKGRNNWATSPIELHSELMSARKRLVDEYAKAGHSYDDALNSVRNQTDKQLDWMIKKQSLNRFFKKGISQEKKREMLRLLPAAIPAVGAIGAMGEGEEQKRNGGWLEKYVPKAQNGIEGTMGGLTDKGFNYNGAWGGPSMETGGNIQPAMAGANQTVPMAQFGDLIKPAIPISPIINLISSFFTTDTKTTTLPKGKKPTLRTIAIKDPRTVRQTSGEKIDPRKDLLTGEYPTELLTDALVTAKKHGLGKDDLWNLAAMALQESHWGKTDRNLGHILGDVGKGDTNDPFVNAYINKMKDADRLKITDPALRLQVYNGLGFVKPETEKDYHGFKMKKIYGVPVPKEGLNLKENPLYGKQIIDVRDNILKKNPEVVDYIEYIDREYTDSKKLQMGGVLPGAVGFTYARTVGAAPSNGPYAKKTKASAQNGQEMKYYQEGLDFKPKTISQDGSEIPVDPEGYWNPENWGNPVIIPSNIITMEGVDQPLLGVSDEGDVQYMEPGEDYEFEGDYVTEYPVAKKGISVNNADAQPVKKLDQLLNFTNYNKPTKGGWLDKYN